MKFYIFAVVFVISAILATGGNANADIVPAGQRAADLDILQTIGGWANQAKDAIAGLGRAADMDRRKVPFIGPKLARVRLFNLGWHFPLQKLRFLGCLWTDLAKILGDL